MRRLTPFPFLFQTSFLSFLSIILLAFQIPTSKASKVIRANTPQPEIVIPPPSSGYVYHGCYNETTGLPDTAGARALSGGADLVRPGLGPDGMTVEMCWEFCRTGAGDASGGTSGRFMFAGLEYARECWCAQSLSSLSKKLPDSECNLPCEGNATQACGGNLKLTVYMAGAATARVAWAAALVAVGAISMALM